jgi:hypothetical protein
MKVVRTPRTEERKRGRRFKTISEETSMKKLARLAAHRFRGSPRKELPRTFRFPAILLYSLVGT